MSRYTMDDLLKDERLFREKFCAEATHDRLGNVPVEALLATIRMIHECSGFRAAATPDRWNRTEQPVIVFGRPTIAGSMNQPKFGLTTHVKVSGDPKGAKMFFWVTGAAHRLAQRKNEQLNLRIISSWLPWREGGRDTCRAMPVPIYEQGILLDPSFMLPGSNEDVTLGSFLSLLGSLLNLRPEVREEFSEITGELDLAPDCITPRAAQIMKDRNRELF